MNRIQKLEYFSFEEDQPCAVYYEIFPLNHTWQTSQHYKINTWAYASRYDCFKFMSNNSKCLVRDSHHSPFICEYNDIICFLPVEMIFKKKQNKVKFILFHFAIGLRVVTRLASRQYYICKCCICLKRQKAG